MGDRLVAGLQIQNTGGRDLEGVKIVSEGWSGNSWDIFTVAEVTPVGSFDKMRSTFYSQVKIPPGETLHMRIVANVVNTGFRGSVNLTFTPYSLHDIDANRPLNNGVWATVVVE